MAKSDRIDIFIDAILTKTGGLIANVSLNQGCVFRISQQQHVS